MLEALDLSAGLLWGMLTCPREMLFSVLDSPLASSSGPFPIFLFIFFFFPLARARTVTCIVLYLSRSRGRERARLTEVTPIDPSVSDPRESILACCPATVSDGLYRDSSLLRIATGRSLFLALPFCIPLKRLLPVCFKRAGTLHRAGVVHCSSSLPTSVLSANVIISLISRI